MADLISRAVIDQAARAKARVAPASNCPFCPGHGSLMFTAYATLHAVPRATGTTVGDELTGVAGAMPADAFLLRSCETCGFTAMFRADRTF